MRPEMNKLKLLAFVVILLAVGGVKAKAQTSTTSTSQVVSFQLNMPGCVNHGLGETVVFSSEGRVLFSYKINSDGTRTGVYMYASRFTGRGAKTGMSYVAYGTTDQEFANQDSFGDGQFSITQNFRVYPGNLTSVDFHNQQNFTVENQGNTLNLPPATTVCK
jgi:hypothetical protein